ncbi:MAG: hypothetical protein J6B54_01460 [Clostridia bacterium]|nr:hypothetical protein [Clostridia bacterium]
MLIHLRSFSQSNLAVSAACYGIAAIIALLLRRWGQVFGGLGKERSLAEFGRILLRDLPSALWAVAFFLGTGCLKGPINTEDRTEDPQKNRKIFFNGILFPFSGAIVSFVLFLLFQTLQASTGWTWDIPGLIAKSSMGANLSLCFFSILPLPASDIEVFLRTKPFGPRGTAFRKNGSWPFLLFTALGLLLACVTLPLPSFYGGDTSLSAILALFPILLLGG